MRTSVLRTIRSALLRRRLVVIGGVLAAAVAIAAWAVWPTSQAQADSVSLFPDDAVPAVVTEADRRPVELGMRFQVTDRVEAVAIQFYKSSANKGPHQGRLWSDRGRELAKAQFADGPRSGLQVGDLDREVVLEPGRDYVVSYSALKGRYSTDQNLFTKPVSRGPITAGVNAGVHSYSPGSFPARTFGAVSYAVDIVVRRTGSETSASPSASPSEGASSTTTDTPTPATSERATPPPSGAASPSTESTSPPPGSSARFPTRDSVGLPEGWRPRRQVSGTYQVTTPGAVIEDLRITNGTIEVHAPNVTLRRVELVGSTITNTAGGSCSQGMVIEDSDIIDGVGTVSVVSAGSYTLRNVRIDGVSEGPQVGGRSSGCGAVSVEQVYIRIVSPTPCGDWHGDGIQGYDGGRLTVRDTTIVFDERPDCGGTAPFFYPADQGNSGPVDIDGLLVQGGGYPFRLGMPGSVRDLAVVDDSWGYQPLDVNCSLVTSWRAQIVTLDRAGQPVPVRALDCG